MPGPLVRIDTPGTDCMREARSVIPRFRISAPETAVRLMGVLSAVISRFSAVTTISSSCPESVWDCWAIATSANIPPKNNRQPKAAMDLYFSFMNPPRARLPRALGEYSPRLPGARGPNRTRRCVIERGFAHQSRGEDRLRPRRELAALEIALEFAAADIPSGSQGAVPAGIGIDVECAARRRREIGVEAAGDSILDDVNGSGTRIRRHRHAAGHGLEIDQPECIGAARKHHDVGRRQVRPELLAEAVAHERGMRRLPLQPRPLRPVADDDFAAGPGHVEERVDILFHRDPADVRRDGALQREKILRMGLENLRIHT